MRRVLIWLPAVGGLLLLLPFLAGGLHRAVADGAEDALDRVTETFPGQVSLAPGGEGFEADAPPFMVADEDRGEAGDDEPGERRRPRHPARPPHDRHRHGPPPHDMHGHRGPPGHHQALRRFDEIIDRLARIEAKLGIDDPAPARRERRPFDDRAEGRSAGDPDRPLRPRPPEDMRQAWEERVAEGRQRMEDARRRFREMEERVKKLEAELERMKAEKRGP